MIKRILILAMLFSGCNSNDKEVSNEIIESPIESVNLPLVSTYEVIKKPFLHYHEIQGNTVSKSMIYIRPEITGIVTRLPFKEGNYVTKGQPLISMSNTTLIAQVEELEQQLEFASFLFDKQKKLYDDGIGTEIQLKELENNVLRLKKAKATINTQIEKSEILAPFSGYIEQLNVQLGESIGPMNIAIHLVNLDDLYVSADVSEDLLPDLKLNNDLVAHFPALDEVLYNLKLTRIGKVVNQVNRTIKIEAKIPNNNINLVPNLMSVLKINDYKNDSAIVLSSRLVLKNDLGETYVKIVTNENKVDVLPVQIGKQQGEMVEVISDLPVGTLVVDKGKSSIASGQTVKVISS